MNWVAVTPTTVLADMPTELSPVYTAWLVDYPAKSGRLAEIITRSISECRDYIRSNPRNSLDADETKLPESVLRHIETVIYYTLCMEMGLNIAAEASSMYRASDIFLRQVGYGNFVITASDIGRPTPSYTPGNDLEAPTERTLPLQ